MSDYLVDLRRLPPVVPVAGLAYGAYPVSRYLDLEFFVGKQFYTQWAQELRFAVARGTCRVLTNPGMETEIVGFACFDATFSGAFGPFGISQSWQRKKCGQFLLLSVLHEMRCRDHRYAIIGDVGIDAAGFYLKSLPDNCEQLRAG